MSQRDGFASGFLAGAVVGGLLGGVIGALVATRFDNDNEVEKPLLNSSLPDAKTLKRRRRQLKAEEGIEVARRSLEDKIAPVEYGNRRCANSARHCQW